MSTYMKERLQVTALIVGIASGCGALTGLTFFLSLPARMEAQEAKSRQLDEERKKDRELLVRIEERLIVVQRDLQNR